MSHGPGDYSPLDGPGKRVIFDKKVAQNPLFQYGSNNEERWKATVTNDLIGERWEMRDLLDWAVRFEKMPIQEHHLLGTQSFMQDNGLDTLQASRELWAEPYQPSLTRPHL